MTSILLIIKDIKTRFTIESHLKFFIPESIVNSANNGTDGLSLSINYQPDIIIVDMLLDDIRASEIVTTLKKDGNKTKSMILILCQESENLEERNLALRNGADDFCNYPIDKIELECSIQLLLRLKKAEKKIKEETELLSIIQKQTRENIASESKLESSQLFLNTLINTIPSPIFYKDCNLKYIGCNEAFADFFGLTKEQIQNKSIFDLAHEEPARIQHQKDLQILQDRIGQSYETYLIDSDGTKKDLIIRKNIFYKPNKTVGGIVGVLIDITDLKVKEKQLQIAKSKAEDSDKIKTIFLSNMSHEIRTPMNAIMGFAQLMSRPNLVDEKKELFIDQILQNSEILLKLIDDIMSISQIEGGEIKISKSDCSIRSIYETLNNDFKIIREKRAKMDIEFKMEIPLATEDFIIKTDPLRLKQILSNLIDNALKFTEAGQVKFGFKIIEQNELPYLHFFVEDTGIGIPEDKLNMIFERFSKIHIINAQFYSGAGLGLFISKKLTELLGGYIEVNSLQNIGTKIHVYIPFPEFSQSKIIKNNSSESGDFNWNNKVFLIAEDEEMNFLFLEEALSETNVKIIRAKNGIEVLNKFNADRKIDLILMDMKMPLMDGFEATVKIKELNKLIPIIAQTAYAMPNERARCFEAGCDDYLVKPIRQELLLNTIRKFIE